MKKDQAHAIAKKAALNAYRITMKKFAQYYETDAEGNRTSERKELHQDFGSPYSGFDPVPQKAAPPKSAPAPEGYTGAPKGYGTGGGAAPAPANPPAPAKQEGETRRYNEIDPDDPLVGLDGEWVGFKFDEDSSMAKDKCPECGCVCGGAKKKEKEAGKHSRLQALAAEFKKALA